MKKLERVLGSALLLCLAPTALADTRYGGGAKYEFRELATQASAGSACEGFVNEILEEQMLGSLDEPSEFVHSLSPFMGNQRKSSFEVLSNSGHVFKGQIKKNGGHMVIKDKYGEKLRQYNLVIDKKSHECKLKSIQQLNPDGGQGAGTFMKVDKKACQKVYVQEVRERKRKEYEKLTADQRKGVPIPSMVTVAYTSERAANKAELIDKACSPAAMKAMGIVTEGKDVLFKHKFADEKLTPEKKEFLKDFAAQMAKANPYIFLRKEFADKDLLMKKIKEINEKNKLNNEQKADADEAAAGSNVR